MADIVIYTKTYCPYSKNAKDFFDKMNVKYDEKVIDNDPALTMEMVTKSGERTDTPQIFINNHHIGSFDDVKALKETGKLYEMLNK